LFGSGLLFWATCTLCLKNVTTLILNNVYKLELILIIFGTLYAEATGS